MRAEVEGREQLGRACFERITELAHGIEIQESALRDLGFLDEWLELISDIGFGSSPGKTLRETAEGMLL